MKSKTIKKILNHKFNDFLSSIKDENVKKLVQKNTIISGGSIVSMLLNETPNDYDIYFKNIETVKAVAEYYVKEFNSLNKRNYSVNIEDNRVKIFIRSDGIDGVDDLFNTESNLENVLINNILDLNPQKHEVEEVIQKYKPIYLTSNAITLSNKVQLIIRFFGEVDDIHKNFDFIHVKNYWESETGKLTLNPVALECILNKELRYDGSLYPVASLFRMRKFLNRDWTINAGEILKIAFQVSELDLTDVKVLEEQLIGVDLSYFNSIIKMIKERNNYDSSINFSYIMNIVNKIF